jgi:hypothetical protein
MTVIAFLAIVFRLGSGRLDPDTVEFAGILVAAGGLTVLLVHLYFALWFAGLGIGRVARRRQEKGAEGF